MPPRGEPPLPGEAGRSRAHFRRASEVQAALNEYHASIRDFAGHVFTFRALRRTADGQQVVEAEGAMQAAREVAREKLDETERVMRDELAKL